MHNTQAIQKDTQATTIKPLVSFIITAYNIPPKMLRQCISSILALSLSREQREIIVVDDGSKEPAINDIKDFIDDVVYIRQRNQGLSVARNTGIQISTGDYIQFVDGDDFLLQAPYEHCLDLLRYHQPVDMVMFDFTSKDESPMSTDYKGPRTGTEYMLNNNIHGTAWGYIFSKAILDDLRFTTGIYHEDEEFTPLLLLRANTLYTTTAAAYYYRKRRGSIIHNHSKEHKDKRLTDILNIIIRLKKVQSCLSDEDKSNALGRRIAQLSMDYLYSVMILTKSRSRLKEAKANLSSIGLYPLPDKDYTLKYKLFRKLI